MHAQNKENWYHFVYKTSNYFEFIQTFWIDIILKCSLCKNSLPVRYALWLVGCLVHILPGCFIYSFLATATGEYDFKAKQIQFGNFNII